MNERIDCLFNEIVNLRLKEAQGTHLVPSTIDMYKRRLVAIVVEECCEVLRQEVEVALSADGDPVDPEGLVRKHFGVEE